MSNYWRDLAKQISHSKTNGKKLSITEKAVLTTLADFHNDKYDRCYPSHDTVAKVINSARETVTKNVNKLVEHGLISLSNRGSGQNSKLVTFLFDESDIIPNSIVTQNHNEAGSIVTQSHSHCDSKAIHCDSKAIHCDAESHELLITNNNYKSNISCANGFARDSDSSANEFERWWKVYPIKKNKKRAKKAWEQVNPDADLLIKDVLNRLENDHQWIDGFAPHPDKYLTDERWNDEIQYKRSESEPATRLPRDDNLLVGWAKDNGYSPPPVGQSFPEYRRMLEGEIQRSTRTQNDSFGYA